MGFVAAYAVLAVVFAIIGIVTDYRWMLILAALAAVAAVVVAMKARRNPSAGG